jgi:hypothetical protein
MEAAAEEICSWVGLHTHDDVLMKLLVLSLFLKLGSILQTPFNCTEEEVTSFMSSITVYQEMLNAAVKFRRFCGRQCFPRYVQWIEENIPCEGEGIIVREYISDPANEFILRRERNIDLTQLRCTERLNSVASS